MPEPSRVLTMALLDVQSWTSNQGLKVNTKPESETVARNCVANHSLNKLWFVITNCENKQTVVCNYDPVIEP